MIRNIRTYCVPVNLRSARAFIKAHPNSKVFGNISDEESLQYLDSLEKVGVEVVPCPHADKKGHCQGTHTEYIDFV